MYIICVAIGNTTALLILRLRIGEIMRTATINTRVDPKTKSQAQHILDDLHITMSEAISMYLRQIIFHRGIPFELKIPNKETLQALKEVERGKGLKSFDSVDDLFEDLES